MKMIEHVALWTLDLERSRSFYERYFDAHAGPRYVNGQKRFTSYESVVLDPDGNRVEIAV